MSLKVVQSKNELIVAVVPFGLGSKVLHVSKKCGVTGGTIFLGKGTIHNTILNLLSITDIRKEIVLMAASTEVASCVLKSLYHKFSFGKPNHGIIFTLLISEVLGTRCLECEVQNVKKVGNHMKYQLITIIVDKGKAEQVIDAATQAGATGGTIINARGSGIHETSKIFAMDIEPEKEIIIILEKGEKIDLIVDKINSELKMDLPGNGILFTQNVNKAFGILK